MGAAEVLVIVFAASALRQAPVLGARGLAISNLIVGSIEAAVCAVAILVVVLIAVFPDPQ
jgi:hypothetical protein